MLNDIIAVLIFFLPAGVANSAPIFAAKLPFLSKFSQPIDFGRTFRGKPVFGKNKTFRGLIAGMVVGSIVAYLIGLLFSSGVLSESYEIIDYERINTVILGALLGFGALIGDSIESFFKRQVGIESGQSWLLFDQADYIVGGLIVASFYAELSIQQVVLTFVVWLTAHFLFTYIGYLLKLKDAPI